MAETETGSAPFALEPSETTYGIAKSKAVAAFRQFARTALMRLIDCIEEDAPLGWVDDLWIGADDYGEAVEYREAAKQIRRALHGEQKE